MTDRVQPGAAGSINRNIEVGEAVGQYSNGWVVPGDSPTISAQRFVDIDDAALAAFNATYDANSLSVDIQPGEAFVDGWLARDVATTIDLAANTAGQEVAIGWDPDAVYDEDLHATRDDADRTIVDLASNLAGDVPAVVIWRFDTDGSGVVDAADLRRTGPALDVDVATVDSVFTVPRYATKADIPTDMPEGSIAYAEDEDTFYKEDGN